MLREGGEGALWDSEGWREERGRWLCLTGCSRDGKIVPHCSNFSCGSKVPNKNSIVSRYVKKAPEFGLGHVSGKLAPGAKQVPQTHMLLRACRKPLCSCSETCALEGSRVHNLDLALGRSLGWCFRA